MLAAERLIFLGFAFHPLNLEVLWDKGERARPTPARCFATGKGISKSDAEAIAADLARLGGLETGKDYSDLICSQLFPEYRRSLSLL